MSFPLFTSIKPLTTADDPSYLRGCLNSWRAAGFDAVAVNGPTETEALRKLDLGIEFAPLVNDGKPRIGAILAAIRERGCRFAGIINSDCRIVAYPDLARHFHAGLERKALIAWRLDVSDGEAPKASSRGFDAYFFDTAILPDDDCGFFIGEPWWDLWFPLACEMHGALVETLAVPVLTHRVHPWNWSWAGWFDSGQHFWTALRGWHARESMPTSLCEKIPAEYWTESHLSHERLHMLSRGINDWLRCDRPQFAKTITSVEIESMLRLGGRAMLAQAEAALEREELLVLRTELENLRPELENLRAALEKMGASTCWRITAPLRTAANAVRLFRHRAIEIMQYGRRRWRPLGF
jgi:hypothetical protein